MLDVVLDLLAEEVDLQVQVGDALDELLGRPESHAYNSSLAPSAAGAALSRAGVGERHTGVAHAFMHKR